MNLFPDIRVLGLINCTSGTGDFVAYQIMKGGVEFVEEFTYEDFKQSSYATTKYPIALVLYGDLILEKTLDKSGSINDAFPFYQKDKMYYTIWRTDKADSYLVGKHEQLNAILNAFELNNPIHEVYLVDNTRATETPIAKWPGWLKELIAGHNVETSEIRAYQNNQRNYSFRQKLARNAVLFLGAWLVILLINFLIYQQLFQKVDTQITSTLNPDQEIAQLQQHIKQLKQGQLAINSGSISILSDIIGKSVPKDVKLTNTELNPISSESNKLSIRQNVCTIQGNCSSTSDLNLFIQQLEDHKQIEKVDLLFVKPVNKKLNFSIQTLCRAY